MKKVLMVLFILIGVAAIASANPKIKIDQPYFNFGHVPQNSTVSHDYWIRNVGTDTLRITKVKPG